MKSILLVKKLLGLVEMTSGLVNASFGLPEWQDVKMIFFAPLLSENQFDNKEQDSLVQKVQALVTIFLLLTHKKTKRSSAQRLVTWQHLRFFFLFTCFNRSTVLSISSGLGGCKASLSTALGGPISNSFTFKTICSRGHL